MKIKIKKNGKRRNLNLFLSTTTLVKIGKNHGKITFSKTTNKQRHKPEVGKPLVEMKTYLVKNTMPCEFSLHSIFDYSCSSLDPVM